MKRLLLSGLIIILLPILAAAAGTDDILINIPNQPRQSFRPGALVVLPDQQKTIIEEILPDGRMRTDLGVVLTPEGIISEGPYAGKAVILVPTRPAPTPETGPEDNPLVPPKDPAANQDNIATPGSEAVLVPQSPASDIQPPAEDNPQQKPLIQQPSPGIILPPQQTAPDKQLSLAEMLPLTETPEQRPMPKTEEPAPKPEAKHPAMSQNAPEKAKKQEKKEENHKPAKIEKPKKAEEKPQPKKEAKAAKPGQAMRIPPEAAKTGNLDFLEGCWQGTRPEYYSKRTIKECFCFGAGGRNGKRRVFDPIGKRQCIGSTKATLSESGVLSVTSSGAVCNDGERWGQAEMICRNSGPKTPCSWVFRDANNASQAYQIPFVRVESCGR